VLSEAVYGGVYRLTTQLLVHFGLEFSFVDTTDPAIVLGALRPNTKMIYIERRQIQRCASRHFGDGQAGE